MTGLLFFAIVAVALVLVALDVVVRRRRGSALAWAVVAGIVLVAGGVVHAADAQGPWSVLTLIAGALCLTLSDRAAAKRSRRTA